MITVQLLGGACLRSADVPLSGPPAQRHRIALLALIVGAWPQPLLRDRAMTLLWPERDTTSARRLLNLAVHVLRGALGDDAIASTGDGLLLNPPRLNCDYHDLRAAIGADAPELVAQLYTAPLLDGFHLDDSTEFGYWLDERRNELSHAYVGALLALADRQEQSGDLHGRVRTWMRLVAADAHSGTYAEGLMRALDGAGNRAGAIYHAGEHARRRRMDLDLDPDAKVVALAKRLRSGTGAAEDAMPADQRSTSVAVLPFRNLNGDGENELFADGITEDVIAHLSKIRSLKVISRTSVMPFKRRQHSLREIGTKLGATAVLDGSIRHSGASVRIVATLIDVGTDQHLWAETYDRQLTDIFSIQTDVALHIAASLKAELTRDEETRARREPTNDLRAYQLFLRGQQSFMEYTSEAVARSIEYFERAIDRDPTFALAHANLGMAYLELVEDGVIAPAIAYARAADVSAKALRLDPDLGEAHSTMGYLKAVGHFDWTGSESAFKQALELSPGNANAYDLYGRLCAALKRYDDAVTLQARAHELDPLAHRMDMVTTLLRAGRYDEAVVKAKEAVELDDGYDRARATLGWAYILNDKHDEGVAELELAVSLSRGHPMWLGQLGNAYARTGRKVKARAILRDLEKKHGARMSHRIISCTCLQGSANTTRRWTLWSARWQSERVPHTASRDRSC